MKIAISRLDHENCSVIVMSLRAPLDNAYCHRPNLGCGLRGKFLYRISLISCIFPLAYLPVKNNHLFKQRTKNRGYSHSQTASINLWFICAPSLVSW